MDEKDKLHITVSPLLPSAKEAGITDIDTASHDVKKSTYYMLDDADYKEGDDTLAEANEVKSENDLRPVHDHSHQVPLARIPTCAVFHKLTHGPGVPHSFVSTCSCEYLSPNTILIASLAIIRVFPSVSRPSAGSCKQLILMQLCFLYDFFPALFQFFLSVRLLPVAHVPPADRYFVTKVRSIDGFYGVTYHLGFRDGFDVDVNSIIDRAYEIEARTNPAGYQSVVADIREVADTASHM